jgi:hypothetical protein
MARSTISGLPLPHPSYRPDKSRCRDAGAKPFESCEACRAEDAKRARSLRQQAAAGSALINPAAALVLADRIDPDFRPEGAVPPTLASSSFLRKHRVRTGHIRHLGDEQGEECATFTLMPKTLVVDATGLMFVNAQDLMNGLRSDLNRAGGSAASGWVVAYLDGEFDPETCKFRLHFHGTATGEMIDVIKRLRTQKKYKRDVGENGRPLCAPPVMVKRVRTDPLGAIAYGLKSYWPARRTGPVRDGEVKRNSFVSRIPEPFLSLSLLWLHQWRLEDISLLYGVYATKTGLRVSS